MTPTSKPVLPAQPNQATYGFQALELFTRYTRESYQAAFGVQAPNFNASQPVKDWFDSTVDASNPANVAVYEAETDFENGTISQVTMPAAVAAAVNLPGLVTYPGYTIQATDAYIGGGGAHLSFDATTLTMQQDAIALAAQFGLGPTSVVDTSLNNGVFVTIYPSDELRREWSINFKGVLVNAGVLIAQQNAKGVGHPGSWDLSGATPNWIPTPDPPDGITAGVQTKIAPHPVRALLQNETVQHGLAGPIVVRTDLISPGVLDGGAATQQQMLVTLLSIQASLQKLGL